MFTSLLKFGVRVKFLALDVGVVYFVHEYG